MNIVVLCQMLEQTSDEEVYHSLCEQKHPLWASCSTSLHIPRMSHIPKIAVPSKRVSQVALVAKQRDPTTQSNTSECLLRNFLFLGNSDAQMERHHCLNQCNSVSPYLQNNWISHTFMCLFWMELSPKNFLEQNTSCWLKLRQKENMVVSALKKLL